jgi:hypothetical protein
MKVVFTDDSGKFFVKRRGIRVFPLPLRERVDRAERERSASRVRGFWFS